MTFRASDFSDPQGAATFAAMKWRIAEVAVGSVAAPVTGGDDDDGAAAGSALVPDGASWRYFKGIAEPSTTAGAWRQLNFDDSKWLTGRTAIGYGENFITTRLDDMRGAYSTVYLRTTFDVTDLATFSKLTLDTKYDDGVNVWLNGNLVYQDNVIAAELPYNATAMTSIEDSTFRTYDLGDPKTRLVQGKNVIAIQVLNSNISNSSDFFIDVRLTAEKSQGGTSTPTANLTPYKRTPGKYEIQAAWESDDLTAFQSDVTIPASVVRPGRTYRVRSRMKDATGRWSHWSAPVQFTAGEPIADGIVADLRITEVMYNPLPSDTLDGDEFEFIELKNTGDETLDLRSVSFTSGVTFDFAGSAVTTLGPGGFALVVKNKAAFESRYGTDPLGPDRRSVRGPAGEHGRERRPRGLLERHDRRVRVRRRPRLAGRRRRRRLLPGAPGFGGAGRAAGLAELPGQLAGEHVCGWFAGPGRSRSRRSRWSSTSSWPTQPARATGSSCIIQPPRR